MVRKKGTHMKGCSYENNEGIMFNASLKIAHFTVLASQCQIGHIDDNTLRYLQISLWVSQFESLSNV